MSCCLAASSPFRILLASFFSSWDLRRGVFPISLKYICTLSGNAPLIFVASFSSFSVISPPPSPKRVSTSITLRLFCSSSSYILSRKLVSSSMFGKYSRISRSVTNPFSWPRVIRAASCSSFFKDPLLGTLLTAVFRALEESFFLESFLVALFLTTFFTLLKLFFTGRVFLTRFFETTFFVFFGLFLFRDFFTFFLRVAFGMFYMLHFAT